MCGLAGFFDGAALEVDAATHLLKRMVDPINHRGPDDEGYWYEPESRIGLGHRRLSIVDLSHAGHQPMRSVSGSYVIVFNGEIYNHLELRNALEVECGEFDWRGHSDTETLLAGFDVWGVEKTVSRSIGMFAFVLFDRKERQLILSRDRFGEKPLYYGWQKEVFLFGSELKSLKAHPAFEGEIDLASIALQMRHNYIPTPYSIYKGIRKLPPGTFLKLPVHRDRFAVKSLPEPIPYWSLRGAINRGVQNPFDGTVSDAVEELDQILRDSVKQQMVADVPLGAFLSGGIDSSTVAALMQSQSSRPVKTFSIGFDETGYNEAVYAKAVAQHLGTEHTELYISPQQAMDVIPRMPSLYDEPFSDSSQIPTFLVSQMTRQHVTVSLSGDAGDELFGGYNRYLLAHRLWGKLSWLPPSVRRLGGSALTSVSPEQWSNIVGPLQRFMPATWRLANVGDKLHKGASVLGCDSLNTLYLGLISHWNSPSSMVIGGSEPETLLNGQDLFLSDLGSIERMMTLDTLTYLPDDLLVKVDRAAMGVSLETRVPFLDHRVVEFAWQLPLSMKIRNGQGKWILRQVLHKYVPKELIERPKMGFGIPIGDWLRGPLRDWAESLLDESRLCHEGFFNPAPIRKKWAEHLSGQRNWQYHLWDVLMFQAWLDEQ